MKRIKWPAIIMVVGLLAACGTPSSSEEKLKEVEDSEKNIESNVSSDSLESEVDEQEDTLNTKEEIGDSESSPPQEEQPSVSREELIEVVRQLEKVNEILHNEGIYKELPYSSVKEDLSPYVTEGWIQDTEPIYEQSYIDLHAGFFPFRVSNNLDVWFDYQVDGDTAYVTTFSPGDDYAYNSYDLEFVLKREEGVWKVDQHDLSFDYGEEGKDFSVEEAKEILERFHGDRDVTYVLTSEEEVVGHDGEYRLKKVYEFEVIQSETGEPAIEKIVAYDGRTLLW